MKRWGGVGAQLVMLLVVQVVHAGGLGVAGDGFLTTFATWIPTVLFIGSLVFSGV